MSRVAAKWGMPAQTVRRLDKRVLRRWAAGRPRTPLRFLGVDEIFLGKGVNFLTVVSNLESGEPLWLGRERKRETLGPLLRRGLAAPAPPVRPSRLRGHVEAVRAEPARASPHARLVYDKFYVLRHASEAVDETRRAEFFRQGRAARGLVRGKRWLLLRSWTHLDRDHRQSLRELFTLNRRLAKAYLLKEQLA